MFSTCYNTFLLFISTHLDTLLVVKQQFHTDLACHYEITITMAFPQQMKNLTFAIYSNY